ncbi:MAG: ATP-binding protein [Pseudomonadota bacterium]
MRLPALLRTTAMRLALRQALLQMLALLLMLAILFAVLEHFTERQVESALRGEAQALASLPMDARVASLTLLAQLHDEARLRYYRLEDSQGRWMAGNLPHGPEEVRLDGRLERMALRLPEEDEGDGEARLAVVAVALPEGGRLLIAQAPGELEDLQDLALGLAAALVVLGGLLALLMGGRLGRQWLARITAINAVAGRIAAGELGQRVPITGRGDEFDLLAEHLNAMLARIEAAVAGMREVSDHVAHDLRRPLTRLKTRIEVALGRPREERDLRAALEASLYDVEEILTTFEALLTIARLEAGSERLLRERFDLGALAEQLHELYAPEFESAGRSLMIHVERPGLEVEGARPLLSQALANLLDNALKHTPPATSVEIEVRGEGAGVRLAVIDHGPGLSANEKSRVLERFVRGDAARSTSGSGLGLPLVRAITQAHGGGLGLKDTPGGGLTVVLVLPAALGAGGGGHPSRNT